MNQLTEKIDDKFGFSDAWALLGVSLISFGTAIIRPNVKNSLSSEEIIILLQSSGHMSFLSDLSTGMIILYSDEGEMLRSFSKDEVGTILLGIGIAKDSYQYFSN